MNTQPIPFSITPETDEYICQRFFADYDIVARAPACAFLFGNHSVVYGHLGLYLPIPRYIYVGLQIIESEKSFSFDTIPLEWISWKTSLSSPNDTFEAFQVEKSTFIDEEAEKALPGAYEVIRSRYFPASRQNLAVKMRAFSQAPTRAGLNSSGAMSAALVMALSAFFETPIDETELATARLAQTDESLSNPYMRGSPLFEKLVTLGWYLDDCFHGFGGTAIGSSGSFMGNDTGLPIIFLAEDRTFQTAKPRHPANYAKAGYADPYARIDKMATLKRLIIRLDDVILNKPQLPDWWKDTAVAILYSGQPKFTRDMLDQINDNLQNYAQSTAISQIFHLAKQKAMILNPLEALLHDRAYTTPETETQALNQNLDWMKQHRKELMMLLMGGTSCLGLEAIFSPQQLEFVDQLRQQQSLFRILGMSRAGIDLICETFGNWRNELGERPFGASITGGGGGGDVVIFSDKKTMENHFELVMERVRESNQLLPTKDPITVHYRSWEERILIAEPAKIIYRRI